MFYLINNFLHFYCMLFFTLIFIVIILRQLMISQSDNVVKLNSINRRMFILATAKVIILGRYSK